MAPRIPSWKDRLAACFQWRHRLMHVFGAPAAVGALAAVGTAAALNPDVGLGMGALVAAVGTVLAGYYVTAGFDRKLIENLQTEETERHHATKESEVAQIVATADPNLQPVLQRILFYHQSIETAFIDGIDDSVEAILQNSRGDLSALRDRALAMAQLFQKLTQIIHHSDGRWLASEVERMDRELGSTSEGSVREALEVARESTKRALDQWQAAIDKQRQVKSVLTVIESNLQEFKLAMELRKADAVLSDQPAQPDVSELQARLAAAGQACDELVGQGERRRRTTRRRAEN